MVSRWCKSLSLLVGGSVMVGCAAAYTVPGKGADIKTIEMVRLDRAQQTDPTVAATLEKKPLATFPTGIAVVRVQAPGYDNKAVQMWGRGAYRVVLTRDVEKPEQIERLQKLPMVAGVITLNRLQLPEDFQNDLPLRNAAANLHADMLLIYTFDDNFEDRDVAPVVTIFTIGIAPTKSLTVTSTASAMLVDSRNGYIYGAAEASESKNTAANPYGETAAAEALRNQVETAAFGKLCGELEKTWGRVVTQYAPSKAMTTQQ